MSTPGTGRHPLVLSPEHHPTPEIDTRHLPTTGPALVIFQGLPGSGKTTLANQLLTAHPDTYRRVSRDHIRRMYFNSPFIPGHPDDREEYVTKLSLAALGQLLEGGYVVLIDDTNLHQPHLTRMFQHLERLRRQGILDLDHHHIHRLDFLAIPIDTCIQRDAQRPQHQQVGEQAIRNMHQRWLDNQPK